MKINKTLKHVFRKNSDFKELFKIMRISLFLLFAFSLHMIAADTKAQDAQVALRSNTVSVRQLINEIEKQTDYLVVYSNSEVNTSRRVNVSNKTDKVASMLDKAFTGTDIDYDFENNYIVLSKNAQQSAALIAQAVEAAQQKHRVTGTVVDDMGYPIIGANIVEEGTTNGSVTDIDGNFVIEVEKNAKLRFSYIGYLDQVVEVGSRSILDIVLQEDTQQLSEVVVTALGIKRKSKGLTYSTQAVGGDDLTQARDVNMINSLAGKSAGVTVAQSSSGMGGSSKVLIRGARSTSGNNQPLYVIDGIPMLNSTNEQPVTSIGGTNDAGGRDSGDGISNLNPEDIESLTILKGASAAALYGTQASNGVVIITTKKGRAGSTSATFSSSFNFENATKMPEFQNRYGADGGSGRSWGSAIGGSDNFANDFFRGGFSAMNTLTLSGGTDMAQTYFSYGNTTAQGIVPGNEFKRHNLTLTESAKFFDKKLHLDGNVQLVNQTGTNRPVAGGLYLNPLVGLYRFPRGGNMAAYKDGFEEYDAGRNMNVQNWHKPLESMEQNPYWITNRMPSKDRRNRAITSLSAKFDFNEHWNIQARGSVDYINDRYDQKIHASTHTALSGENGRYILENREEMQLYSDVILNFNKDFGNVSLTAAAGTSINDQRVRGERLDSRPKDLYYANVFTIGNMELGQVAQTDMHKQVQSVFGTAQVGYNDYLFLDVTARNDWSSSLAYTDSRKSGFFYPSVGVSGVLSDMLDMPASTFGKVRASWSEVGNDIPIHISYPVHRINAGGNLIFNSIAPFDKLKPEKSRSVELGTEWRFFYNKLNVDLTYYKTNTTNQLFTLPAPAGSGYSEYYVNAGNIQNQGIEGIVSITPFASNDFYWNSSFNFAVNKNKVKEIHEDLAEFRYGQQSSNSYWMKLEEGGAIGDIYGVAFERDASGNIKYDDENLPVKSSDYIKVGNASPDFTLGWNNTLNYKNFGLNILVDGSFGGDVMSLTQADLDQYGVTKTTADARDAGHVMLEGKRIDDVHGFYNRVGGRDGISEYYMYDATSVRLRELALSYTFDKSILGANSFVNSISLSVVGRNLFFFYLNAPYDPSALLSTGNNLQGVDVYGMPATRSFGVNLKVNF